VYDHISDSGGSSEDNLPSLEEIFGLRTPKSLRKARVIDLTGDDDEVSILQQQEYPPDSLRAESLSLSSFDCRCRLLTTAPGVGLAFCHRSFIASIVYAVAEPSNQPCA